MTRVNTSGPWLRGRANGANGIDGKGYAICAGPHVIARVTGLGYPIGRGSHPESDANANLIAAAPDLLKALKLLVEAFHDCDDRSIIDHARVAIAKAEGRECCCPSAPGKLAAHGAEVLSDACPTHGAHANPAGWPRGGSR